MQKLLNRSSQKGERNGRVIDRINALVYCFCNLNWQMI